MDKYRSYQELAAEQREGLDYRKIVREVTSSCVIIVAPHGGAIEPGTSELVRSVAGDDLNFYLFEGIRKEGGNFDLHIASQRFDEPTCIELVNRMKVVIAIHGCRDDESAIYVGGLDTELRECLTSELMKAGFPVRPVTPIYAGIEPMNICNKGASGFGAQLEISRDIRQGGKTRELAEAIRRAIHCLKGKLDGADVELPDGSVSDLIFSKFLKNLSANNFPPELIERMRAVLLDSKSVTERALILALYEDNAET